MLFIPQTHLKLNPLKTKIFFRSQRKRAYLKKPNGFGRSNTQARVYLFIPQTNKLF
ncbi:hypothetical protein HPHPH30_1568 [Helicobacter pylori Hp H-30]|nr:hypothetical protein HPHPH30_1568 [Helicobacter pylori Hp H-30]